MSYSLGRAGLGVLATVNADRITRIKQGLQDLRLLPAGVQAPMDETAYALKQWATSQGLPPSYVVWNGTSLQIDNVLADRFAAAVTAARAAPRATTSASTPNTAQFVQSAAKTDPSETPFIPPATITAPSSPSFFQRIPWWGWAAGAVGVGVVGYLVVSKRKPATMTANRRRRSRRIRRNTSTTAKAAPASLSYRRTTRISRTSRPKPRRKVGKLRLLVRGRGKKMYVYPRRKRAEVLRGKVSITPNRRRRIAANGRIDVQYGLGAYGKAYADDWVVKPYDLPYYHRSYGMKSLEHAKRFAESVVKAIRKAGFEARTIRDDQKMAANSADYIVKAERPNRQSDNVYVGSYEKARRWQLKNHSKLIKRGYKSTELVKAKFHSKTGRPQS